MSLSGESDKPSLAELIILTIEDVATHLKCSVKTARRRVEAGVIRSFKEGGRVCVLKSDFEAYLREQIRKSRTP